MARQSVVVAWQQNARTYASCCCGQPQNRHISYVIFESLNMIMSDSLLSRARACEDGRGLESSCGENSMRSGVEARHRSFQQKP